MTDRRLVLSALAAATLVACAAKAPRQAAPPAAAAAPAAAKGETRNPFPGTTTRMGRNGETYYCWDYAPTGTRIAEEVCATEQQLKDQSSRERQAFEAMRERAVTAPCPPGMAC